MPPGAGSVTTAPYGSGYASRRDGAHKVRHILTLQQDLTENRFTPDEVRRFTLKQANGKERELATLTLKDKIAQRALLQVLTPHFERRFHPDSFGYRPGRNVDMAFRGRG